MSSHASKKKNALSAKTTNVIQRRNALKSDPSAPIDVCPSKCRRYPMA